MKCVEKNIKPAVAGFFVLDAAVVAAVGSVLLISGCLGPLERWATDYEKV